MSSDHIIEKKCRGRPRKYDKSEVKDINAKYMKQYMKEYIKKRSLMLAQTEELCEFCHKNINGRNVWKHKQTLEHKKNVQASQRDKLLNDYINRDKQFRALFQQLAALVAD